ncbi:MAG: sodium/solute symporter [Clostridiales bacterium]|nr:sodium/solute symporter [Clostridiales bacterium]
MLTKIILVIVFFAILISVGIYSRKNATDANAFVLGGRSVGPWLTAFAYGTSYFSAVVFVGYAGQFGWKYGISSTWIGIGNAIIGSLLAWLVLAKRTRVMTHHLDVVTMPSYFEKRYDSKALKIAASAIVFIFLIPYTASVYNGLSNLFEMAFGIPYKYCVLAMAILTAIYVIVGGYMATAINDFIQGCIMLVGIVLIIMAVLNNQGGLTSAVAKMAEVVATDSAGNTTSPGAFASIFGPDPLGLLGVVILTSLGTWGLPQMVHKFYAIKDEQAVKTGTIVSTFFALVVSGGCYFLGGFGRLFDSSAIYSESGAIAYDAIVPYILETSLPDVLIAVVIMLVLSASMSTLSSLVLTSSSTLTIDFIKEMFMKNMSDKKQVLLMRILIVFFIVISVVIALDPPTFIAQLMGISWGALAGAFLAPFMYGLYWKGVTRLSVWACFIFGVVLTVSNVYLKFIASPINAGAIAMIGGLILVPVVSLFTPKFENRFTDKIFSCFSK